MNTRKIFLLCAWLLAFGCLYAQVPQLISYQAVARDLTGKVLSEKAISVQVEILQGSNQGTAVYSETHDLTTTKTGTINLLIGGGNAQIGTFAAIDWSQSPYFLRLSMKQEKETAYTEVSNTQMVSVPYALFAEKAGKVINENTGEGSDLKQDFILTCAGDSNDNIILFTALSGGTIPTYAYQSSSDGNIYTDSELAFTIVYKSGIDLQLTAEVEGGAKLYPEYCSESTIYGRCYSFYFDYFPEKHPLTLYIKDKEGKVLASYPFFIQCANL